MQSNEHNPTQGQQKEMAAKSPAKTPAAGSAAPDAQTQAREVGSTKHAGAAQPVQTKEPAPLPPVQRAEIPATDDPLARAKARIVSVDVAGMAASDDTVDTDGKGLEARRDASQWQDNVIYSNATLDNNIPVPAEGLVNLDTRSVRNMPVIATRPGWQITELGTVDIAQHNGTRAERLFTLDRIGSRNGNARKN